MDIPLPEDPPVEESSLHDIPFPDEANRYSPSLPIEDDPPDLKDISEISLPTLPAASMMQNVVLPAVLGRSAAKKRLLAFSMAKQTIKKVKNDKNSFEEATFGKIVVRESEQPGLKKKRKKGVLDKARDIISEIEEIKRKENVVRESMQLLYPRWVNRDNAGSSSGPLSLPDIEEDDSYKIETLVEKLLAKKAKRERTDKEKESEKRERRERREKEKIVPKCWEEFNKAGFTAYHYRRLKYRREKLPRSNKHRNRARSDGEETDSSGKKKFNLFETPMVLKVPLTVIGLDDDYKDFPSWCVKYTNTRPKISYSVNPALDRSMLLSRNEMLDSLTEEISDIITKFLELKPLQRAKDEPVDNRSWYKTEEFMVSHLQEIPNTINIELKDKLSFDSVVVKTEPEDYSEEEAFGKEEDSRNIQGLEKEEQEEEEDTKDYEEQSKNELIVEENGIEQSKSQEREIEREEKYKEEIGHGQLGSLFEYSGEEQTLDRVLDENIVECSGNVIESVHEGMLASEYEQFIKTIEDRHSEKILGNKEEDLLQNNSLFVVGGEDEWSRTTSIDKNPENTSCTVEKVKKSSKSSSKYKSTTQDNIVNNKKKKMLFKKRKRNRSVSTSSDSSTTSTTSSSSSSSSSSTSSSSSSSSQSSSSSSSTSTTSSSSSNDSSSESSSSSSTSFESVSSSESRSAFKKKKLKRKLKKKVLLNKKRKQKDNAAKKARLSKKKTKKIKNSLEKKRSKLSPPLKIKREKRKENENDETNEERDRHKHSERLLNSSGELYFPKVEELQEDSEYSISSCKKGMPTNVRGSIESSGGIPFNKPRHSKSDLFSPENSHLSSDCRARLPTKRHFNLDIFQEEKSSNSNSDNFSPAPGRNRLIDYDFSSDDSQNVKDINPKGKSVENVGSLVHGTDESCEKSPEIYSPTAADYDEDEEEETNKLKVSENVSTVNSSHIDESSQLVSFGVNSASQEARMLDIPLPPPKQIAAVPLNTQVNLTTSFHNILQQSPSSASFSPQRKTEEKRESPICIGKSGARLTFGKQMTKLKPLNIFSGEDSDSETANDKGLHTLDKGLSPSEKPVNDRSSREYKFEKLASNEKEKSVIGLTGISQVTVMESINASPAEKKSRWDISELPTSANKNEVVDAVSSTHQSDKPEEGDITRHYSKPTDTRTDRSYSGRNRSRSRSNERRPKPSLEEDHFRSRDRRNSRDRKSSREKKRESKARDRSRDRRSRHSNERRRSSERSSQYKYRQNSPHRSKLSPFSSKMKQLDSRSKISPSTSHINSYCLPQDKSLTEGYNVDFIYQGSEDYNTLDNDVGNSTSVDSHDKNYITIKPCESGLYGSPLTRQSQGQRSSLTRENLGKRQRSPSYNDSPSHRSPEYDKDSSYYRAKGSPSRRRTTPDRRSSPDYKRGGSPLRRRSSPERMRNYSPYRWESPVRRNPSPGKGRRSPPFRRYSPERKRDSFNDQENYTDNNSYGRRSISPPKRRSLSPQKRRSPSYISEERRGVPRFIRSPVSHISPSGTPSGDTSNEWKWNYQSNIQNESNFNISEFTSQNKKLITYNQEVDINVNDYQMSLADSTISDSELVKDVSPKRLSLDERLQLELGESDVNMAKGDNTSNFNNYYYQSDVNESINYYSHQTQYPKSAITSSNLIQPPTVDWNIAKPHPTTQVVQVGNVLQVVPTEITTMNTSYTSKPNNVTSVKKPPKIVQVGNVLQVVPRPEIGINDEMDAPKQQSEHVPEIQQQNIVKQQEVHVQQLHHTQPPPPPPSQLQPNITQFLPVPPPAIGALTPAQIIAVPPPPPPHTSSVGPVLSVYTSATVVTVPAENALPQTIQAVPQMKVIPTTSLVAPPVGSPAKLVKLEEKEKRRKAKELRRRKKEQKAAKRLKMLRAAAAEEEANSAIESLKTSDNPPVAPVPLPSPDKGILISSGFRDTPPSGSESKKVKSVSFADGIRPGYGSSPSGGEEHPLSPPPIVRQKTKRKKRRKVKVRIVRIEGNSSKNDDDEDEDEEEEDEEEDDDDLSPPPPPPGTPPPEAYLDYTTAGGYMYPQPYTVATTGNDDKLQSQMVLPIKGLTPTPVINYGAPPPPPPPPVNTAVLR